MTRWSPVDNIFLWLDILMIIKEGYNVNSIEQSYSHLSFTPRHFLTEGLYNTTIWLAKLEGWGSAFLRKKLIVLEDGNKSVGD